MAKASPSSAANAADAKSKNVKYVAAANSKPVNLALQGGGAHGAFAWGVLDRLLEDGRLSFDAVSATSAGAMNATVLGYGLTIGGADGAREELEKFWKKISDEGAKGPLQPSWIDKAMGNHSLDFSPAFTFFDILSRLMSPYELNPLNINPLRAVLESSVDFGVLREGCPIKLFLSATNVRTGKVRLFENHEIGPDQVLASGCLPFMFQTVMIDGEGYWDGGYMGNPAIFPLIYGSETNDVVIVHINPLNREEIPKTAKDILNRINEISFNSSLMREMRAIAFVSHLIDQGQLVDEDHRRMLIHSIQDELFMESLGATSKLNPDWTFMKKLRDVGRQSATLWLDSHFDDVGIRSSADIKASFL